MLLCSRGAIIVSARNLVPANALIILSSSFFIFWLSYHSQRISVSPINVDEILACNMYKMPGTEATNSDRIAKKKQSIFKYMPHSCCYYIPRPGSRIIYFTWMWNCRHSLSKQTENWTYNWHAYNPHTHTHTHSNIQPLHCMLAAFR